MVRNNYSENSFEICNQDNTDDHVYLKSHEHEDKLLHKNDLIIPDEEDALRKISDISDNEIVFSLNGKIVPKSSSDIRKGYLSKLMYHRVWLAPI